VYIYISDIDTHICIYLYISIYIYISRGWGSVVDVVRASVVLDDWDGVLCCLHTVRGDFDVEILRVRNRFTATADVPQVKTLKSQPTRTCSMYDKHTTCHSSPSTWY